MADSRFFASVGPFPLEHLAAVAGAELSSPGAAAKVISDVAPLDTAGPDALSFLDNPRYMDQFRASRAGACVVRPERATDAPAGMALLLTTDPYMAYARIALALYPEPAPSAGLSRSAVVDPTALIGEGTEIGAGAIIGPRAEIGRHCRIGPNVVIGAGVVIGDASSIGACASLRCCILGARVLVLAGVRIGEDGFGFASDAKGHVKVPQLGRVIIGDDVEIGANATIDRGAGPDTIVGPGCRIDNLVQIGHNVQLGRGCIVVAQAGISGSTKLGDFAIVAAQGGITGHLTIGPGARIGAQSGVMRDVAAGESVGGSPAVPVRQWLRQHAILQRLAKKERA